jgi:uncharacterized protein
MHVQLSVAPSRFAYGLIADAGVFVLAFPGRELAEATQYCGGHSGRDVNTFAPRERVFVWVARVDEDDRRAPSAHVSSMPLHCGMADAVTELRTRVEDILRQRGVVRAYVFGFVARGEDHAVSDVDFLVEFEPGRSLWDLAGLRLDLIERLDREVDVVAPNALHPKIRQAVLRERVPLS